MSRVGSGLSDGIGHWGTVTYHPRERRSRRWDISDRAGHACGRRGRPFPLPGERVRVRAELTVRRLGANEYVPVVGTIGPAPSPSRGEREFMRLHRAHCGFVRRMHALLTQEWHIESPSLWSAQRTLRRW